MWLMNHYQGSDSRLNEQVLWELPPGYDGDALGRALELLLHRHESLRSSLEMRRRRLYRIVHPTAESGLVSLDLRDRSDRAQAVRDAAADQLAIGIDPGALPLRPVLVELADGSGLLCLTLHHLATDGWSNGVLGRDIRSLYARVLGEGDPLPAIGWSYSDWVGWEQERLSGESRRRLLDYWSRTLDGAALPDLPRAGDGTLRPRSVRASFTAEETAQLQRLARANRTPLVAVLLAVFAAVVGRLADTEDVAVPNLLANRERPEVSETVGYFVNLVVLRVRFALGAPFTDAIGAARAAMLEGLRHQVMPYHLLPPGTVTAASGRVEDIVFQYMSMSGMVERADVLGSERDSLAAQIDRGRFDLDFVAFDDGDVVSVVLRYGPVMLDPQRAQEFVELYLQVTRAAAVDATRPLHELFP